MLVNCGRFFLPDPNRLIIPANLNTTSLVIDASGEKAAMLATVPVTGSITHVMVRVGTVTSAQALSVSLQTFDATTGDPTGTAYGGSAAGSIATPASSTSYRVALATPASATSGDRVFVVVEFSGTVGNLTICSAGSTTAIGYPYIDLFASAAWGKIAGMPLMTLDYNGTVYDCETVTYSAVNSTNVNNASTPDEYALLFVPPMKCRLVGFNALVTPTATNADYDVILYNAASSVLTSRSMPAKGVPVVSSNRPNIDFFATPVVLTAGATYRLAFKPTTANNVNVTSYDFRAAADMDGMPGGQSFSYSTRKSSGAWTDAAKRLAAAIVVDQVDDGAGGPTYFSY